MAFKIAMGQKDLLRSKEMELVKQKKQTIKAAGVKLKVSYRQAKRIYAAYLVGGDCAGGITVPAETLEEMAARRGFMAAAQEDKRASEQTGSPSMFWRSCAI